MRVIVDRDELLTSTEVIEFSGLISYRQLDYWAETGLIEPVVPADGSGSQRLWDPSVIAEIADLIHRIQQCPFDHPGHKESRQKKDSRRTSPPAAGKLRRRGPSGMLRRIP